MFYFPDHNKERGFRFLGRQVIKLHHIPLLGEFHPGDFFSFFSGRRRPASVSFHSTVLCFMHGCMSFPQGGGACCLQRLLISSYFWVRPLKISTYIFNLITKWTNYIYLFIPAATSPLQRNGQKWNTWNRWSFEPNISFMYDDCKLSTGNRISAQECLFTHIMTTNQHYQHITIAISRWHI